MTTPRTITVAKVSWLAACAAVLAWSVVGCDQTVLDPTLRSECRFVWGTVALTGLSFPLGVIWWVATSASAYWLGVFGAELGVWFDIAASAGSVVVGYVQWFILLPLVVRKISPESRNASENI